MKLMYITNDPRIAEFAESCGVNRIFVDMEYLGKDERQGHLDTHKARHTISDIKAVKKVLKSAELLVRVNPIHTDSGQEINDAINAGADIIMLPMFTTAIEVREFIKIVNKRAQVSLLLETPKALVRIHEILALSNEIDEIHIGLNDLHLGMNLDFMFELLAGGIVDMAVKQIKQNDLRVGIGGIACIGQGIIPAELILSEHVRLGSEMVILSRTFHSSATDLDDLKSKIDLKFEIKSIFDALENLKALEQEGIDENRRLFRKAVSNFVNQKYQSSLI